MNKSKEFDELFVFALSNLREAYGTIERKNNQEILGSNNLMFFKNKTWQDDILQTPFFSFANVF